jgi:hypothetical protein
VKTDRVSRRRSIPWAIIWYTWAKDASNGYAGAPPCLIRGPLGVNGEGKSTEARLRCCPGKPRRCGLDKVADLWQGLELQCWVVLASGRKKEGKKKEALPLPLLEKSDRCACGIPPQNMTGFVRGGCCSWRRKQTAERWSTR